MTPWEETVHDFDGASDVDPVKATAKPLKTREQVIKILRDNGVNEAKATLYADAYLEYQTATANIAEYGMIVKHPRTGNPIENPYLAIRDRAEKKLGRMVYLNSRGLW